MLYIAYMDPSNYWTQKPITTRNWAWPSFSGVLSTCCSPHAISCQQDQCEMVEVWGLHDSNQIHPTYFYIFVDSCIFLEHNQRIPSSQFLDCFNFYKIWFERGFCLLLLLLWPSVVVELDYLFVLWGPVGCLVGPISIVKVLVFLFYRTSSIITLWMTVGICLVTKQKSLETTGQIRSPRPLQVINEDLIFFNNSSEV